MLNVRFWGMVAIALTSVLRSSRAITESNVQAIQIGKQVQKDWQFEVSRVQRKASTDFEVEIVSKGIQPPSEFTAHLSSVKIDQNSTEIGGGREITCDRDQTIVCTFTVTDAALQNPDYGVVMYSPAFTMVNGQKQYMPSGSFLYFKLKDVPLSEISVWRQIWLLFEEIRHK